MVVSVTTILLHPTQGMTCPKQLAGGKLGMAGFFGGRKEAEMNWVFWACLSALFAGLTAILAKIGVKDVDSNLATAIRTVVILIFAWAVALFRTTQSLTEVSSRAWLFLVLSGLATGASWLCYFRALQLGPASQVAPVDKLSLVFVIVLAWLFLGEPLTWKTVIGGTMVVAGVLTLATK